MSTDYTYSETNDFPNSVIDLRTLEGSILSSDIAVTLSYITVDGGICNIVFESDLSPSEQTTLDSIVGSHTGVSEEGEVAPIYIGDVPDTSTTKFWLRPENNVVYCYDDVRSKWLSTNRSIFSFARKGNASGMYIPLLGDLDAADDAYSPNKDSTIVSVFCRSQSGAEDKGFEIRKNGSSIYSFDYDGSGSLTYTNTDIDLNIDSADRLQVYVVKNGGNVINTICRIEMAWRYDI